MKAEVKSIDWSDKDARELKVIIKAKGSAYIEEPKGHGFAEIINSDPIIEGLNYVLEFGHHAVSAMKRNDFMALAAENRQLRQTIQKSELADRVKQLLSAIDYALLTDFQAKCVLLVERELKG